MCSEQSRTEEGGALESTQMRLETPNWLASRVDARARRWALSRIDPWSALKFALLFYVSIAIVLVVTSLLLYVASAAGGVRGHIETVVHSLGWDTWKLTAGGVLWFTSLVALAFVIIWSGITVCLVFLYNLVCDLVGGIEFTVADRNP
jgi:transmembrane protein DUF3566